MQDELLIKFIDGKCSQEEADKVFNDLSLEGEDALEWVQMQTASALAGAKPFETVRTEDARRFVTEVIGRDRNILVRRKVLKWSGIAAGLCAVAASLAIILTVGRSGHDSGFPEEGDSLAFAGDSSSHATGQPESEISGTEVGENETPSSVELSQGTSKGVSEPVPQSLPSVNYDRNASRNDAPGSSATSGTQATSGTNSGSPANPSSSASDARRESQPSAERTLKMTRPSKSPYRVRVKDLSKDFVFEWETEGAVSASLLVKDRDGMTLVDEKIEELTENRLPVSVMCLTDRGELLWKLVLEYPDGGTLSRTGRLELRSEIE